MCGGRLPFPPEIIRDSSHGQKDHVGGMGGGPARVTGWGEGKNRSRKS
jgi:hypothetical protein